MVKKLKGKGRGNEEKRKGKDVAGDEKLEKAPKCSLT